MRGRWNERGRSLYVFIKRDLDHHNRRNGVRDDNKGTLSDHGMLLTLLKRIRKTASERWRFRSSPPTQ